MTRSVAFQPLCAVLPVVLFLGALGLLRRRSSAARK